MDIKTILQPPYNPDLAPCDFWLFPKLTGCRYETIEEMKEAVTRVVYRVCLWVTIYIYIYIYKQDVAVTAKA